MNIAIIDDSSVDRTLLAEAIVARARESSILISITEYENGESFLQKATMETPDVVFLTSNTYNKFHECFTG